MPVFSDSSKKRLGECDSRLREVMNFVIRYFDFSILCGHRDKEDQEIAFNEGNTKVHYPNSRHNSAPSEAVDAVPYPIIWEDLKGMTPEQIKQTQIYAAQCYFAGFVRGVGAVKGIEITWGGDWNNNGKIEPGDCWDRPHFEIRK